MSRLVNRWTPWLLAILGSFLSFHPMLLSGLQRTQGDTGDTRLLNYILEHEYRVLVSGHPGRGMWDPPVFHPVRDVLAHSDTLLSVLPVYGILRLAGILPDTAFQVWWMALAALNYAGAFLLLRRPCGCSRFAAASGAFLFAFGAPRIAQTGHQQLFAQFFTIGCLYALARLWTDTAGAPGSWMRSSKAVPTDSASLQDTAGAPRWWIAAFSVCYAGQFYASFYLWFFLTLALVLAGVPALMHSPSRKRTLGMLRRAPLAFTLAAIGVMLLLMPGALHYAAARNTIGPLPADQMTRLLPRIYSWIYLGPHNWLYGWQSRMQPFRSLYMDQEHRLGIGAITSCVALLGLMIGRHKAYVRLVAGVAAILILTVTVWPPGFALWPYVAAVLPGAEAIRAPGRVALVVLLAGSLGVALALEALGKRSMLLASAVLAACIGEQVSSTPSFDKMAVRQHVAKLASEVNRACGAFLYTPVRSVPLPPGKLLNRTIKNQIDAMWAGLEAGVPTVNGYSGYPPFDWPFADIAIYSEADRERISAGLDQWAQARGLDANSVCRVETRPDETWDPGNLADFLRRRGWFGLR